DRRQFFEVALNRPKRHRSDQCRFFSIHGKKLHFLQLSSHHLPNQSQISLQKQAFQMAKLFGSGLQFSMEISFDSLMSLHKNLFFDWKSEKGIDAKDIREPYGFQRLESRPLPPAESSSENHFELFQDPSL